MITPELDINIITRSRRMIKFLLRKMGYESINENDERLILLEKRLSLISNNFKKEVTLLRREIRQLSTKVNKFSKANTKKKEVASSKKDVAQIVSSALDNSL